MWGAPRALGSAQPPAAGPKLLPHSPCPWWSAERERRGPAAAGCALWEQALPPPGVRASAPGRWDCGHCESS